MRDFPSDVAEQLKALEKMKAAELRALWQEAFGRPHPAWLQRDFLACALAYHFQESAYGGLSAALAGRLRTLADEMAIPGRVVKIAKMRIKPGTRLVREWGGETHVVTVLDGKFDYRGKRYASLSEIARAITKTRWSGPAFFGMKGNGSAAKGAPGGEPA